MNRYPLVPIEYRDSAAGIEPGMLSGFFEGWPQPPTPARHLRILQGSSHVVLAVDADAERVIGFINALTDGAQSAFLPLLEVLPEYRGQGIGRELVLRMLAVLDDYPAIDLCCDPALRPFYEKLGMTAVVGMLIRHPHKTGPASQVG